MFVEISQELMNSFEEQQTSEQVQEKKNLISTELKVTSECDCWSVNVGEAADRLNAPGGVNK